ncbi:MAG: glutamine--tRNA ligase/YqeY domain fusion protein [Gammaproteobacteria bacterium]|nr:glutamine--tRNA ligase/YqeY domain fusion protein [Gammaproteobacteria bacterium]
MTEETKTSSNFVKNIIIKDLAEHKNNGQVITRFPPEPNGYLHIGHAKSVCLNFGLAEEFDGRCYLRFDDTNPTKEDVEYVDSIKEDINWLGFQWDNLYFASDYYDKLYEFAVELIKKGLAYVCPLTAEQMREYRGTLTEPGINSPARDSSVEENLRFFEAMKNGDFADGERVLRAKIDMAAPNLNLRDPVIYRIRRATHHRTGDRWIIYPMYDFAHGLSDMLENITHSICTLEFEAHRPLYDWYLDVLNTPCHPQQIEFARLNLTYTILSKRKLLELVQDKHVDGWDDPRMPTIRGMRRRGYPAAAIRDLCERVGVTKKDSCIDFASLEACVRENLDASAARRMAVLDPIKVVITNYPEDKTEELECANHPKNPEMGMRKVPFARKIFIERADFMEEPAPKYHRLAPGKNVRLRYAYVITCDEVIKDASGEITELRCHYHEDTKHGKTPEGMSKVKGIIHWVASATAFTNCEVRLYDRLFAVEFPGSDRMCDFKLDMNPDSLEIKTNVKLEPILAGAPIESYYQFERLGYFFVDHELSTKEKLIFNRTVSLRDTWRKISKA